MVCNAEDESVTLGYVGDLLCRPVLDVMSMVDISQRGLILR